MKKAQWIVAGMFVASSLLFSVKAQAGLQEAMVASYAAEANRNVLGAISALKAVEATEGENYVFNLRMGWLDYLAGKWNESVTYYQNAAGIAPAAVEPLQGMLLPLAAAGKTGELLKTHEMVLKNDAHNYKSLSQAAWLSYQGKNYAQAAKFYARILKLYPTDVEMMLGLGYSQKFAGNKEEADKAFNEVLLLSPRNARALAGLK